jgi:hypothetical protein
MNPPSTPQPGGAQSFTDARGLDTPTSTPQPGGAQSWTDARGANSSVPYDGSGAGGGGPASWWDQFKGGVSTASQWMEKNPTMAKNAAGLIQGAFQYEGQQALEDSRMKRQMQYQDWARQRYSDSVRNLTIPTIQTRPNAPPPVQSPVSLSPGLIGGARG